MFVLPTRPRRIVYCVIFEIIAVLLSGPMLWVLGGGDPFHSWAVAAVVSAIAVTWNYLYNTMFEAWERQRPPARRTFRLRCLHASLFEMGLLVATVPLYMVWYQVDLWQAFQMEIAVLVFFLLYTLAFTWIFDKMVAFPAHPHQGTATV